MKTKFILLLLTFFLILPTHSSGKISFSKDFSYYAEQQDISLVLIQFAKSQGYTASISPQIEGKISGKFNQVNPNDFLNSMQSAFQVSWYTLANTIYFYNIKEFQQAFITSHSMSATHMFSLLKEANVFSKELPPKLGQNGNVISIEGPQSYIETIQNAAKSFELAQTQNIVMKVFPLKYAWADDITINSMDKQITIPGVATILRAMLTRSTNSASKQIQQKATVTGLNGTGLSIVGTENKENQEPQNSLLSNVNIMADPRVNAVIINDASYRMPYYAEVIQDLDKPVELVEIHAAIVDIDTNYKRDLGVTYQAKNEHTNGWSGGGELGNNTQNFKPLPELGKLGSSGLSLSTIYTMGADFFLAKIQALEEDGEARMLGKPSVLTVDNVQATLENTSTYYLEIKGYQAVDLFKVEAGTVLRVTPHIIHNENGTSSIKLAVNVQDNQNNTQGTAIQADGIPPIKQTKINTQAIVGTNQSLLIGGYYYEEKTDNDSGIPILKNIPFLGHAFKSSNKNSRRMERLILITPKIIRLDEVPTTPNYIDEQSFKKSPTQDTYNIRETPQNSGSGCTRKHTSLQQS